MMLYKSTLLALFSALLFIGLLGCEKEGPAEQAGKAIDEAASDVADETENLVETLEKKTEE